VDYRPRIYTWTSIHRGRRRGLRGRRGRWPSVLFNFLPITVCTISGNMRSLVFFSSYSSSHLFTRPFIHPLSMMLAILHFSYNCWSIVSLLLVCLFKFYTLFYITMPSKAPRVEPLSRDHWENFPPSVDQDLWRRYVNEEDSDSDASDTEQEGSMAGPSNASKSTKVDVSGAKPISRNDLVSYLKFYS
jgi:hypothetical protein